VDSAHSHREIVSLGAYEGYDPRDDYDDDDNDEDDDDEDGVKSRPGTLPFGDNGQAHLFSVDCHKHKEKHHGRNSA